MFGVYRGESGGVDFGWYRPWGLIIREIPLTDVAFLVSHS